MFQNESPDTFGAFGDHSPLNLQCNICHFHLRFLVLLLLLHFPLVPKLFERRTKPGNRVRRGQLEIE
ncbi:hypothetical protein GE061_015760 [Apolygus lucorum]|uniref:Uncharacterized protein n=1 Tax=Apolygus lucorum TaxID=248454 RepID=A0A8S9XQZ7_APOLU|nr:hypothetical protein GE061_015760 [Apolygus lucorum]